MSVNVYKDGKLMPIASGGGSNSEETLAAANSYTNEKMNQANSYTDEKINKITRVKEYSLLSTDWNAEIPYVQTINDADVVESDAPIVSLKYIDTDSTEESKAKSEAFGCIDRVSTTDGAITFYCYSKAPTTNFIVLAKGV